MVKRFCCCLSLKVGAFVMAFANIMIGMAELIGGIVGLYGSTDEGSNTLFTVCIILGLIAILNGGLLTMGIIQGKERYILMYLLIGSSYLLILSIYSGINMFQYKFLFIIFVLTDLLWYCQYCMYGFYEEVSQYNTVNSGVIEIAFNDKGHVNSLAVNDSLVENTTV